VAPKDPEIAAWLPTGSTGPMGTFHLGGLTIQLGGFVDTIGVFRSRNETTSYSSNFGAIPVLQNPAAHESETRLTLQNSRFSMLMHGDIDPMQRIAAYVELDLGGAASTANSNESNSYTPRLRQAYVGYDNDRRDLHALVG